MSAPKKPTNKESAIARSELPEQTEVLRDRQQAVIVALLTHQTRTAACESCGVSRQALYTWLKHDKWFQEAYRDAKRELYAHAMGLLMEKSRKAADYLGAVLDDIDAPAAVKVSAARAVLEHARDHDQMVELEDRLAALEKMLAEMTADQG
jgi:hypothetical protein